MQRGRAKKRGPETGPRRNIICKDLKGCDHLLWAIFSFIRLLALKPGTETGGSWLVAFVFGLV